MIPTALNQHDASNAVMNIILLLNNTPHRYRVEQMSCISLVHRSDLTGSQVKSNNDVVVIFTSICVHVTEVTI